MIEKEVRGFIQKEDFANVIAKFTTLLGEPKHAERISLTLADYDNLTLETRIRITNGKAEVVQKVGDFTSVDREEITIKLEGLTSEQLLDIYRTYKHFLKDVPNPMLTLIQNENFVFKNDRVEVKLFRQFGNDEFFAFEVEALTEMEDSELDSFCSQNGLIIDVNYNDLESIQKRNSRVNIDLKILEDEALKELLTQYLQIK